MPKLQCPKCKQPIEISALPADNRVKCGSCSAEFTLKASAPKAAQATASSAASGKPAAAATAKVTAGSPNTTATTSSKPAATAKPTTQAGSPSKPKATGANQGNSNQVSEADDPFSSLDIESLGKSKRVDLGVAPISSGMSESPQGDRAPWLPGNAISYRPLTEAEAAALQSGVKQTEGGAPLPPPKSNKTMTIAVIAVLVLMAGGSIVAAMIVALK